MTWKEFKEKVESAGVTNDMPVDWIDVMGGCSPDDIDVELKPDGRADIYGDNVGDADDA